MPITRRKLPKHFHDFEDFLGEESRIYVFSYTEEKEQQSEESVPVPTVTEPSKKKKGIWNPLHLLFHPENW